MSRPQVNRSASRRFTSFQADSLNRPERIVLLVLVVGGASLDVVTYFAVPGADPLRSALSAATTLTFALFAWSPVVATAALAAAVALSFFLGNASMGLVAGAIAAAPVLRLAGTRLIMAYAAAFLIATAVFAINRGATDPTSIAVTLIVATFAGAVGLALRTAYARGNRLEQELAEQAEREREAVLAERRWIAGELHDSIAHHLTIVAMHSQLLDDDSSRPTSQDAIRSAARKALTDLRFVIQLAEDAPTGTEVPSGDLADAIDEAREEFQAAGHPVVIEGDPNDETIPRGAEIILARVVRESATNVLKYAGPGEVHLTLQVETDSVGMHIRSPQPAIPRRDLPSTGTGLNRMAERVLGVSGEFSAGPVDDTWLVSVRLPIATTPATPKSTQTTE